MEGGNFLKSVLITGSNRGLGKVLVRKFAMEKYCVFAHARKFNYDFESDLQDISSQCKVPIFPVYFDMLDSDTMKKSIKTIFQSKQSIDVLVNNAGIAHGGLFRMTSMNDIKHVFDINLFSVMELTQIVARGMERKNNGSIINITSISGLDLSIGNCAYGVSKSALIAFTKTLAAEYTPLGIRVNAVAPGLLETDMAKQMEDKAYQDMINQSLMKRLGKPSEIAELITFLASDKASFISGQVIRIDGGKT